jgi:hypothetical protein
MKSQLWMLWFPAGCVVLGGLLLLAVFSRNSDPPKDPATQGPDPQQSVWPGTKTQNQAEGSPAMVAGLRPEGTGEGVFSSSTRREEIFSVATRPVREGGESPGVDKVTTAVPSGFSFRKDLFKHWFGMGPVKMTRELALELSNSSSAPSAYFIYAESSGDHTIRVSPGLSPMGPVIVSRAGICVFAGADNPDSVGYANCGINWETETAWLKARRLLSALAASFDPQPIRNPTGDSLEYSPYGPNALSQIHLKFWLRRNNEEVSPVYAVACEKTEPSCERAWRILKEEFFCPIQKKYPWQPEPGSEYFTMTKWNEAGEMTPEYKAWLRAHVPPILERSYDIGTPESRREVVQGPNPYTVHRAADFPDCPSIANPRNLPATP